MISSGDKKNGTLVIQPLPGIGDVVWHLPHLKAIAGRSRDRRITLLTKQRTLAREVLAGTDFVREVLYLEPDGGRHDGPLGGWRLGADLAEHAFEEIWILHHSVRYALAACKAGIKERIGYGIGWQDAFLTSPHSLSRRERQLSAIDKASRLLVLHDLNPVSLRPELQLTDEALAVAKTIFASVPKPRAGLLIGSSEVVKQWGESNFAALIENMRLEKDQPIVLIGGASEQGMADSLANRFGRPSWLILAIDKPILAAAAVAASCEVCIGNDTGMLNVAAAAGTKSIGLFGASQPITRDDRIIAVLPESKRHRNKNQMANITVDSVMRSLVNLDSG
ncbi:MAG: glycosyl transferase family 1 [Rhodospirillaceae bacterium]|nr:glycosyl transferase family 1 [Rhodospirillaceae bacterium]